MRGVSQGGGGGGGHRGGGRRVLRRVVSVAAPRAALGLACGRGELALEQRNGPAGAAAAGRVQVRGDTERADAEGAALSGRAARARHRHDEGGRHAERDEEVLAVMMLRKGRSRPRGVFDD